MKIALITGASSGLGREFACQISKDYENLDELWLVARRGERLKKLSDQFSIPVKIFADDLENSDVYEKVKKELRHNFADIRVLVNAAGYGLNGPVSGMNIDEQTGMIDVNCKALTKLTLIALPHMKKGSQIINIASACAFSPQPGFGIYAATKSYVYSFSRSLGAELKKRGITVTVVCPGPVNTEFFKRSGEVKGSMKNKFRANSSEVVSQALRDVNAGKEVSIYGNSMKFIRAVSKIIPDCLLIEIMKKINRIGV